MEAPINIKNEVTVNGDGGTPAQNADLAKQIGTQLEDAMRATVVRELMKQMRPGGLLR
jgi:hypothetical protein